MFTTDTELRPATMASWRTDAVTLTVDFPPSSFARLAELFAFPNRRLPVDEDETADQCGESELSRQSNVE